MYPFFHTFAFQSSSPRPSLSRPRRGICRFSRTCPIPFERLLLGVEDLETRAFELSANRIAAVGSTSRFRCNEAFHVDSKLRSSSKCISASDLGLRHADETAERAKYSIISDQILASEIGPSQPLTPATSRSRWATLINLSHLRDIFTMAQESHSQALDSQNHNTTSTSLLPEISQRPSLAQSVTSYEVVKEDSKGDEGIGGVEKENKRISVIDDDAKYLTGSTLTSPLPALPLSFSERYPKRSRSFADTSSTFFSMCFSLRRTPRRRLHCDAALSLPRCLGLDCSWTCASYHSIEVKSSASDNLFDIDECFFIRFNALEQLSWIASSYFLTQVSSLFRPRATRKHN